MKSVNRKASLEKPNGSFAIIIGNLTTAMPGGINYSPVLKLLQWGTGKRISTAFFKSPLCDLPGDALSAAGEGAIVVDRNGAGIFEEPAMKAFLENFEKKPVLMIGGRCDEPNDLKPPIIEARNAGLEVFGTRQLLVGPEYDFFEHVLENNNGARPYTALKANQTRVLESLYREYEKICSRFFDTVDDLILHVEDALKRNGQ